MSSCSLLLTANSGIVDGFGHKVPGGTAQYLSNLVMQRLGIKSRSEKPGLLGRCSIQLQSSVEKWPMQKGSFRISTSMHGAMASIRIETVWGLTVQAAGIKVRPVESRHRSAVKLKNGQIVSALPLGFIIYLEDGTRIYNASDTGLFSDMKLIGELYRPHIGLMNVTIENCFDFLPDFLTGEMTPYEAALASQWLNLEYAIACHYTKKDCPDVNQFIELLNNMRSEDKPYVKPVAMNPGEAFVYGK